jgi:hypothetical protein
VLSPTLRLRSRCEERGLVAGFGGGSVVGDPPAHAHTRTHARPSPPPSADAVGRGLAHSARSSRHLWGGRTPLHRSGRLSLWHDGLCRTSRRAPPHLLPRCHADREPRAGVKTPGSRSANTFRRRERWQPRTACEQSRGLVPVVEAVEGRAGDARGRPHDRAGRCVRSSDHGRGEERRAGCDENFRGHETLSSICGAPPRSSRHPGVRIAPTD